jgi:hypothetical protein
LSSLLPGGGDGGGGGEGRLRADVEGVLLELGEEERVVGGPGL